MKHIHGLGLLSFAMIASAVLAPIPVRAQDSSIELSIGGLVFKRHPSVSIESQELTITSEQIKARYRILNQGQAPVTLTVSFPLPDIDLTDADNIAIPTSDPLNPVGFETKIEGQSGSYNVIQRAFLGDKDVSQAVRDAGLPLIVSGGHQDRIARLSQSVRDRLLDDGLIQNAGNDERGRQLFGGTWIVKTSATREQVFLPGRPITIDHVYRTSLGISFDTVLRKALRDNRGMRAAVQRYRKDYCITDQFLAEIDKIAGTAEANAAQLQERRINYVLMTGANSLASIKDFRLTVDQGSPGRLTSFCADNVKKISPTVFETRAKDFTPKRDLKILMVDRRK